MIYNKKRGARITANPSLSACIFEAGPEKILSGC